MANDVVLGIDLGTSAVKILALCKDGLPLYPFGAAPIDSSAKWL